MEKIAEEPENQKTSDVSDDLKYVNGLNSEESSMKKGWYYMGFVEQGLIGFIVGIGLFGLIMTIAGFLAYLSVGSYRLYYNAEYKYKVQATLYEKNKYVRERDHFDYKLWVKDGKDIYRKNSDSYRDTKRKKVYGLDWEFYIDGTRHTVHTVETHFCFRRVGSKKTFRVYSNDGEKYEVSEISIFMALFLILTSAVTLLMAYCIIRLIIAEIIYLIKKLV